MSQIENLNVFGNQSVADRNSNLMDLQQNDGDFIHTSTSQSNDDMQINGVEKFNSRLKFWSNSFRPLLDENVVIMAVIKDSKFLKVSLKELMQVLIMSGAVKVLKQFFVLPNNSFFYLKFNMAADAEWFMKKVDTFKRNEIYFVKKEEQDTLVKITADNIPVDLAKKEFGQYFKNYGTIVSLRANVIVLPEAIKFEVAPITMELKLNKGVLIDSLPFTFVFNNVKYFLKVYGKEKSCFRCSKGGHLAAQCPLRFCNECKKLTTVPHRCVISYASKVKMSQTQISEVYETVNDDVSLNDQDVEYVSAEEFYRNFPVINQNVQDTGHAEADTENVQSGSSDGGRPVGGEKPAGHESDSAASEVENMVMDQAVSTEDEKKKKRKRPK